MTEKGLPKIVLTGGPGGGKTTALDLFRREFPDKVVVVPESATMLFKGGIDRGSDERTIKATQKTIFELQKNIENIKTCQCPDSVLVCDRGTLDGLAYWPGTEDEFFEEINSTLEAELAKYDAVIFLETAAASNKSIKSNNPVRTETEKQAIELDKKLQAIWKRHPNYHFISSTESFLRKINFGVLTIDNVIRKYTNE